MKCKSWLQIFEISKSTGFVASAQSYYMFNTKIATESKKMLLAYIQCR